MPLRRARGPRAPVPHAARRPALIGFLVALAIGVALLLDASAGSERQLVDTLGVQVTEPVAFVEPGSLVCQSPIQLEPGIAAARWVLNTRKRPGPPLELQVREVGEGSRVLLRTEVKGGYGDGPRDVPMEGAPTDRLVDLCLRNDGRTTLDVYGTNAVARVDQTVRGAQLGRYINETSELSIDGKPQGGDAAIEFPGHETTSFLGGLGDIPRRAAAWLPSPFGPWSVVLLMIAIVVAGTGGLAAALMRATADDDHAGERPAGRRALALLLVVAAVFGSAWALLTPPWQVPDEPVHFAYAQTVVEERRLPGQEGAPFAADLVDALRLTNFNSPIFVPAAHPEWSPEKADRVKAASTQLPKDNGGGEHGAASYPPAYYIYEAPAYLVLRGQATTTRLYGMRLWNVLLLLVSVAAAWALIGEVLGRRPVAQLAGAATAGLWPMATFLISGVNPDGGLIAAWALVAAIAARCAVRGLTVRRGIALAVAAGLAFLVKPTGLALIPPVVLLLAYCAWRGRAAGRRRVLVPLGAALAALAALPLVWSIVTRAAERPAFSHVASASETAGFNLREFVSYLWQFYLPRLGFMEPVQHHFPIVSDRPVLNTWLGSGTGTFGWVNLWFPPWVYWVVGSALVIAAAAAIAWVGGRWRAGSRPAAPRLAAVGVVVLGLLLITGGTHWSDYAFYRSDYGPFAQGRYILPGVLPVLALMVGAGVQALGRYRGAAAGVWLAGLVTLQLASLGLVVERFYLA